MTKLIELNNLNSDNFIELLRDSNIIMYENIQGCKILFNFTGSELTIKQKNKTNQPINKIDLTFQKFYNKAIKYLENLDERIKKLCPDNYWFSCEYFPDEKPSHIKYDKLPNNHLILTSIVKDNVYTFEYEEILEFSNLLNISPLPLLFIGKLDEKQIELIKYFLHTRKEDLELIFGESNINFISFFYKIFNPYEKNSILMDEGNFQNKLDKIIIRVQNEDEISLMILNPLYDKTTEKMENYSELYSIILLDFLEFLQGINLNNKFIKSKTGDEIYLEFISELFNKYIEEREWRVKNFKFTIPPYFHDDKFKINKELILNKQTKYLIDSSDKIEFIFKVILHGFRFKKEKITGIFNKNTLKIFNNYVDIISGIIDKSLRIEREEELMKHNLLDFGSFYKIKYPQPDADGKHYPELYKKLEDEVSSTNKKKKSIK